MLNPRILYSDRFHHDAEISRGITRRITQMGQVHYLDDFTPASLDLLHDLPPPSDRILRRVWSSPTSLCFHRELRQEG
jgi:hypothetical protein